MTDNQIIDIDLGNGESLQIIVTHEGIIMDHYGDPKIREMDLISTVGMTFDEWTEWMAKS